MTPHLFSSLSDATRHRLIAACGVVILLLSAGSGLLPVLDNDAGPAIVGRLLIAAGLTEIFAGALHTQAKGLSMLAGLATALAGLLIGFNAHANFSSTAVVVTGWLGLRGAILIVAGLRSSGSVRTWTLFSAGMDLFLAIVLVIGVSISALVLTLFGQTSPVVAAFAWVLALSFVVTGSMLLEVASCERRGAAPAQ